MKLSIKIKKRSQNEWMLLYILCLPFLMGLLYDLLHLPKAVNYTIDFVLIGLLGNYLFKHNRLRSHDEKILRYFVFTFFGYTAISYLVNYSSGLYYLWGLRNNFRFYLFFFLCIYYFSKNNIERFFTLLDKVFYLNCFVVFFQYSMLGIKQDRLGGIFGTGLGVNGYLNVFLVVIFIKSVVFFLNKKEKLHTIVVQSSLMLIISAFAELKYFYIEFVLIVAASSLVTKFSWRKLLIVIASVVGVYFGIRLLIKIFPQFSNYSSLEAIFELASSSKGYTSSGDINRLTVVNFIIERFFNSRKQVFIGLGLGNCDTSAFEFLNTPFYRTYGFLHYTWISSSFVFIEMGIIGYIFFFGFYIVNALVLIIKKTGDMIFRQMSIVMSIASIAIAVYNSSLRTEIAYLIYFFIALPYIRPPELGKMKTDIQY